MKYAPILVAALLLAACETLPTAASSTTETGARLEGDLDLGAWRTANEASTLTAFQQNVTNRYRVGLALSDATADLRRAEFICGDAPPRDEEGRGTPPAQVCRRTVTVQGCTHTWQVHLFDENASLSHTRGLYDRRCGNEGLLGGPG